MSDPWVILEELAANGLHSVEIEVRLDGKEVKLTDKAFELAMGGKDAKPTGPVSAESLKAALAYLEIDRRTEEEISEKADSGDEWAQRAKQGLILRQLVKFRGDARKLVKAALSGSEKAKQAILVIRSQALGQGPERNRARVASWLLRDAERDLNGRSVKVAAEVKGENENAQA